MTGSIVPMPGMGKMEMGGVQTTQSLLGGHLMFSLIEADPIPGSEMRYRGNVLLAWDATANHYAALDLGSFGERTEYQARVSAPDTWVWTGDAVIYGMYQQIRSVVKQTGEDRLEMSSSRLAGTLPEETSLEAVLERIK